MLLNLRTFRLTFPPHSVFQLDRKPRPLPTVNIRRKVEKIEDFTFEDFVLKGYNPYPKIKMEMAV